MVRKSNRVEISRSEFKKFIDVARNFSEGGQVAYEFEYYNAAGVLIVHAAIALADSLTIKSGGVKCKGENHYEVLNLIKEKFPDDAERKIALNHLEAIISHKNSVSYSGDLYTKKDLEKLFNHFHRFSIWANKILK